MEEEQAKEERGKVLAAGLQGVSSLAMKKHLITPPSRGLGEVETASKINTEIKNKFRQVLGVSITHAPRPMRHSLDLAIKYSIDPVQEAHAIWLADLALSLPLPAGWVRVQHPDEGVLFWHNELTGGSQWMHPIDDFIKMNLKILRSPSHQHSLVMRRSSIGYLNSNNPSRC